MVMWFGGVLALVASTLFVGTAGVSFGALGFGFTLALIMAALIVSGWQLKQRGHDLAGGLLATLFLGLVPLLVFSIGDLLGVDGEFLAYRSFYSWISSQWVWMELATIIAGVAIVRAFDFGFATLPPAIASYFLVMDFGVSVFDAGFETMSLLLGLGVGTIMLGLGLRYELLGKAGHATWLLLYGLLSYSYAIGELVQNGTVKALVYIVFGLGCLVLGWAIRRGVPVTVGGLAIAGSLGYLTFDYFDNSILFSLAVFAVGVGIVVSATFVGRASSTPVSEPVTEGGPVATRS